MRLISPNVSGSTVLLGEWLLGQLLSKLAWEQGTIDPALHRIWPQVVKMATGVQTQIVLAVTKRRVSRQVNFSSDSLHRNPKHSNQKEWVAQQACRQREKGEARIKFWYVLQYLNLQRCLAHKPSLRNSHSPILPPSSPALQVGKTAHESSNDAIVTGIFTREISHIRFQLWWWSHGF